ncbi:hypothetical protein Y1Q_0007420 [Alligator mississippiensis]|uniref:ribonuclease H n=1 Tax=Alligator mississippiensis TaxID=8496 RepID=A0A151P7R6_ALLMI|nr:hypothetical protein Y1Q_0007420 [Alligator mississippiensis]
MGWVTFIENDEEDLGPQGSRRDVAPPEKVEQFIGVGEDLSKPQKRETWRLIHEFQDVFRKEPGWVQDAIHTIKTPPGAIVREKWRPIPHHLLEAVRKEVSSMLRLGVVRPSRSPWRSPLVPMRKPDGSLRLCIDYRRLNVLAVFNASPMPQVYELIERIGEAQYISTLDLAKGYWQIPVALAHRPKTAFGTPWGLYEFVRMPFGLHEAAATFQRLMDRLLAPHAGYAAAYIDDIIIYSPTWAHHKQALRTILSELRQASLTANPQKCTLAKRETKYLGFLVGRGTIRPLADKVEMVRNFPATQNCRQLRSFLGLTNYYRRFVPYFAELTAPLMAALKGRRNGPVKWTEEMEQSFGKLKQALCEDVIMHVPNFRKTFILQTDASETAVGAVLTQEEEGIERPIVYASRKLSAAERRYATIEQECLAIRWAVDHFRYYLMSREFKLVTDHASLRWLSTAKTDNARITRWALALQPYKFQIVFRPGKSNTVTDFLSRCDSKNSSERMEHGAEKPANAPGELGRRKNPGAAKGPTYLPQSRKS